MAAFNIPLMVDKPQFDTPLDAQRKVLGTKQLAGAVASQDRDRQADEQARQMNALKIKDEQAKILEDEASRADREMLKSHEKIATDAILANGGDWTKTYKDLQGKVDPRILKAHSDEFDSFVKAKSARDKATRETDDANLKLVGDELIGLLETPTELLPNAYRASLARLSSRGIDVSQYPPDRVPGAAELKAMAAQVGYSKQVSDLAKAQAAEEDKKKSTADSIRQTAREEVARRFSPAVVSDQATWDAFRDAIDDSGPNGGLRRDYAKKFDPTETPKQVARLARNQKEQDAIDNQKRDDTRGEETPEYKNYLLSKKDGFKGNFEQWQDREKKPTRGQLATVESKKQSALKESQGRLQSEIAKAAGDESIIAQSWSDHRERAQTAQNAYEQELGVLNDKDVDHFEYPSAADLRVGKTSAAPAATVATPKKVKMKAPNGDVSEVTEDQVAHYESLGAKRVK